MPSRTGTGVASVVDWLNNQLGTSLPQTPSAVAVAGGFWGSAAHYRVFPQKLLTNQYAMSLRLNADAVPAYSGGPGVSYSPWQARQAYYMILARVRTDTTGGEGEFSRVCAHKVRPHGLHVGRGAAVALTLRCSASS